MSDFPKHAATVNLGVGVLTTAADTSLTAPSTPTQFWAAGANGSKVSRVRVKAVEALAADTVRFFLKRGGTYYLMWEVTFSNTTTPAAGVASQEISFVPDDGDCDFMTGDTIHATTHIAKDYHIFIFGADY